MTADRLSRRLSHHCSPPPVRPACIGNVLGALPLPSLSSPRTCARRLFAVIASLGLLLIGGLSHAVIPASERAVLRALYTSTGGAGWTTSTNWNGAAGTECTWFGVTCNAGDANVTQINLGSNNLVGTLPATLNQMNALQVFDVSFNQLSGTIPALTGLTALRDFYAYNNQLTGSMPTLTGLTALEDFRVHNNQLTGSIPALAGLTALTRFYAYLNQLTGSIPALTGLTALGVFFVDNNQLTGSIPALTGLSALRSFHVYDNQLTGSIPSLSGLDALQFFSVNNNQLTGAIPAVPAPINALVVGLSDLCPNQLTVSVDAAWDAATPGATWDIGCTAALPNQTLSFGVAPTLLVGGTGTVTASAAPLPNSINPIVFASLTPLVCSVNAASGLVTVLPAAVVSSTCTLTADKAGDTTANSAPQVQQSITITALVVNFNVTPSAGANGAISPNTVQSVVSGATTAFTVTPNAGFSASVAGTCGGTLVGSTYTTNAIAADCTVIASFVPIVVVTAPDAPTMAIATPGNGQVTIAFTAPASNGGSAILDYTVTCAPGGTATGASSPLTVLGLTNGTAYSCTVSARNSAGSSPASVAVGVTPVAPTAIGAATPVPTLGPLGLIALALSIVSIGAALRRRASV
jgi:Fibronectin type III domain